MNFNFSNFTEIFKNIGAIKEQAEQIRTRMSRMRITGEAGAGMVRVTVSGEGTLTDIKIDPGLLNRESAEMVEELILSATNDAIKKSREAMAHEMKNLTGGIPIPGLEKFFGG